MLLVLLVLLLVVVLVAGVGVGVDVGVDTNAKHVRAYPEVVQRHTHGGGVASVPVRAVAATSGDV